MMRYYNLEITNSQTGNPVLGADGSKFGPWSSLLPAAKGDPNAIGGNNPGALRIKFDIPVYSFDSPMGGGYVRIWGIPLTVLYQASQFNPSPDWSQYCDIKLYAGMSKGLPLANPAQSGLIVDGAIQQAFGNWQGTEQTLDFIIVPSGGTYGNYGSPQFPKNIVMNWQQGQTIGDAASNALTSAFPGAKITGADQLNSALTLPYSQQPGFYQSVEQFANYLKNTSQSIVNGSSGPSAYSGVRIIPTQNGFSLFDGTNQGTPKQIAFNDLIGQPTWLSPLTLNFKTVLRADLSVGDSIKMPVTNTVTTAASASQYRNKSTFQGTFEISSIRHLGDSRQPSGDSWVTVVDCFSTQQTASS